VFQSLVNDARLAAAAFIERYLVRASVAVPFVIALGFATAAIGLALTERFGATKAFWMMAAGFCAIGLVAAKVVTLKEQEAAAAQEQQQDAEGGLGEIASTAAMQSAGQLPLGLLVSLLGNPTNSALVAAGLLRRNMPLVLLLVLVALLLWPTEEVNTPLDDADEGQFPDDLGPATAVEDPLWKAA